MRYQLGCQLIRILKNCGVIEPEWTPLVRYLRGNRAQTPGLPKFRDLLLCALGRISAPLHLPFRRWIWAIGEKESRDFDGLAAASGIKGKIETPSATCHVATIV